MSNEQKLDLIEKFFDEPLTDEEQYIMKSKLADPFFRSDILLAARMIDQLVYAESCGLIDMLKKLD
jgi:hypothetical protein